MRLALVFSLLIAGIAIVFAAQNPDQVQVSFWPLGSTIPLPLSLVIVGSVLVGLILGVLGGLPARLRHTRELKALRKQPPPSSAASAPAVAPATDAHRAEADPYTERFGAPPHQL